MHSIAIQPVFWRCSLLLLLVTILTNSQELPTSTSTVLIHFTLEHSHGSLWRITDLSWLATNVDEPFWSIKHRLVRQTHHRYPLIDWRHLLKADFSHKFSDRLIRLGHEIDEPLLLHGDQKRQQFLLACDLTSQQSPSTNEFVQNCTLFKVETLRINHYARPKLSLLLNVFLNTTRQVSSKPGGSSLAVSDSKGPLYRLASVIEENRRLVVRCLLKKRCLIQQQHHSTEHWFTTSPLNALHQPSVTLLAQTDHATYTAWLLVMVICLFSTILVLFRYYIVQINLIQ